MQTAPCCAESFEYGFLQVLKYVKITADGSETVLNTCTMKGKHSYCLHLPACASNDKTTFKVFS